MEENLIRSRSNSKDLIRSRSNSLENYNEKYMKIRFISDDDFPLKRTVELNNVMIVAKSVFHDGSKYYPQILIDECLYKLA